MARLIETLSTRFGLATAFTILVVIALVSYSSIDRFVEGARWVDHTRTVIVQLEELMSALEQAESTQRAYLISGDVRFLAPYRETAATLPGKIEVLRRMTADNRAQQQAIIALGPLLEKRVALLEHGVDLKRTEALDAASASLHLYAGKAIMDQVSRGIGSVKAEEDKLLAARSAAFDRDERGTLWMMVIGNFAALAVLIFAFQVSRREIAARRAAEAGACRYAEEVEDLYNRAPCGYHSVDAGGTIVRINDTELGWLGYDRVEVEGRMKHPDLMTAESARAFWSEHFPAFMRQGWLKDIEFDYVRKDGTMLSVLLNASMVRDAEGNCVMSRSTLFDISDRRRAERALRESNAFLDSVFEHIPDMVFVKDAKDLRFVRFNRAGANLLGCNSADLIGKSDADFFPPEQAEFFTQKDRQTLAGGALVEIAEEPLQTRDQGLRTLRTKKIPIAGDDGAPRYLLGISEDITERKEAERRVRALNEQLELRAAQLEAANKELEGFSYSVSHDLRAPLRAVDGYSHMLQEDYSDRLDDEGRRLLSVIRHNARTMGTLIDDLLAFSRLGRQSLRIAEVDMTALAREAFDQLAQHLPHAAPRFVLHALPAVPGDRTLLQQVWVNLLSNAAKYSSTRDAAVVEVTGQGNGTECIYCVQDNGVGFDMKYSHKLFGVFQRLHTASEFSGTGVGLAIVERVVSRHGGRVWVQAQVGEGAAFYFSLPRGAQHG